MTKLKKAAVIGGGVIGGGWAARLLLAGVDVTVADPDPDALAKIENIVSNARRSMARLWPDMGTLGQANIEGKLSYAPLKEAVIGAQLIQESAPERLDLKKRIHAEIGAAASPDAVIASSTSGLLPSDIQADMPHAERMLVAHPYNPVYLLPVVEIVGGEKTSNDAIETAMQIYSDIGMKPLHIKKEIDAFVGDRLLEAMWRESLWLIKDGIATAEVIDDVVRYGLGLRYAQMGQFMTYRLGGGEAGMQHFLEQFAPSLKWPWTKLMDVPEWDDALVAKIASQSDEQAGGKSIAELEEIRDNNLVDILKALHRNDWGAGKLLKKPQVSGAADAPLDSDKAITWTGHVAADWTDYNNHMTEFRYLQVFSMATDQLLVWIGAGPAYVETESSWFTLETHIKHLGEVAAAKPLRVETQILDHDSKRIHLFHSLYSGDDNRLLATGEHMLMHVDMAASRGSAMPAAMLAACDKISRRQTDKTRPDGAGASIAIRRK